MILAGKDQITQMYHGSLFGLQMGRPVKNVENLLNVNVKEQQAVCAANAIPLTWFVLCSVLAHVQIVFHMTTNLLLHYSFPLTIPLIVFIVYPIQTNVSLYHFKNVFLIFVLIQYRIVS